MNTNNAAALRQFLAAAGCFDGLAPALLLASIDASEMVSAEDPDLLTLARDANAAAQLACEEHNDVPPVTFEIDGFGYAETDRGRIYYPGCLRYGGGRTFAQLEIQIGDVWVYSLGIREHGRVTVESAITLAASIERRARAAAAVPAPVEPEGLTVIRRSALPEDATC